MFRSLHMKLVLILVLLIVSVMAVVGIFLINSVGSFYLEDFRSQVQDTLWTGDVMAAMENAAAAPAGAEALKNVVAAYDTQLGLDQYRSFSILDAEGKFLTGSAANAASAEQFYRRPNIIAAMAGQASCSGSVIDSYMDYAIPVCLDGSVRFIVYINDDKQEISELSYRYFAIVMQAMMFGLVVAILLSFLLSKTITTPLENITQGAKRIADGDFGQQLSIQSSDEIGELTSAFNYMAHALHSTLNEVQGERNKLETIFLHMTDGVAAFTFDGALIHMNPATENYLGIRFEDNVTFDDMFDDLALPEKSDGRRTYLQSEITRYGRVLTVTLAPYGTIDGDGGVMAVIHDITEQRKLDDARREFVANVSHELRTPLTNIRSYTETLIDAAGDLPQETEIKFLGIVTSEAERMARIVTDLLTLSKLDYNQMDLRFTRFSTHAMLEAVYNAMVLNASEQGHSFQMEIPDTLPDMNGDRERLEQVIVNIVSNSIKYTPQGGHITLSARMQDERLLQIVVRDDGMGIPKNDVPRLFERFYRVDKARSREKGGTGLGLAIAKEMVEAHRGSIRLESELDKGTTVTILLPIDLPLEDV